MPSVTQTLHTFNSGDTFIGAQVEGDSVVIGETRNAEHANEGHFDHLLTVIPLQEAIAFAKKLLAEQDALNAWIDDDAAYAAWLEEQALRHDDYKALVDSALEHEVAF